MRIAGKYCGILHHHKPAQNCSHFILNLNHLGIKIPRCNYHNYQLVSTLVQTENFFVGHLASMDETKSLTHTQIAFSGVEDDILRAKTPGYMRMLTMSNRFVIPVQANLYRPERGE